MKFFTFLAYFFALSTTFWVLEVSLNTLDEKCEGGKPSFIQRLSVTILGYLGQPPPSAPWWNPLCQMTSPDMSENLHALYSYLTFCLVIILCFRSAELRKSVRSKDSQARKVIIFMYKEEDSSEAMDVPQSKTAQNSVVKKTIVQKTAPLLYLFWSLKDIEFKEPVIPDYVKQGCFSNLFFAGQTRQRNPLYILLDNMKHSFPNQNNSNISQNNVNNDIEEITRPQNPPKSEGRFDKVLLGPVSVCFEALSLVVAATFRSYGIEHSAIKWSTEKDTFGGPEKITALSTTMMAEISIHEITIYRVTGVQGLLRSVSYQTYLVTYNGLVRKEDATTCMYGSGWNM